MKPLNPADLRVESAIRHQRIDGAVPLERWVELDERLRPELAGPQGVLDFFPDVVVVDVDEAPDLVLVAVEKFGMEGEGIHGRLKS